MTKNCELRIKHYLDEEDENFEYIGKPQIINLEHYVNKENAKKELYFVPEDPSSPIKMIKVALSITVRPSTSKVTSN